MGPGTGSISQAEQDPQPVQADPRQSKTALAIQSVAVVPGVSQGKLSARMYPLGKSNLQSVRLAKALLSAQRRLCGHVPGIAEFDRLECLWPAQRQSQMPG